MSEGSPGKSPVKIFVTVGTQLPFDRLVAGVRRAIDFFGNR